MVRKAKQTKKRFLQGRRKTWFFEGRAQSSLKPIAVALSTNQEITHKTAQELGALILEADRKPFDASSNLKGNFVWKNPCKGRFRPFTFKNYIYPIGYKAEKAEASRSRQRVIYTRDIAARRGQRCGGDVLFKLTAADAPNEPIVSDSSATRVWRIVLEKQKKRKELNMPPSKQLISGPKFFGLSNVQVQLRLEGLEGAEKCEKYRFLIQKSYSARLNEQRKTADENIQYGTLQDTGVARRQNT